jgi:DNA modification methylase
MTTKRLAAGIALNQVGVRGGWEFESLTEDLDKLRRTDFGFDGIGFDGSDLDRMQAAKALASAKEPEEVSFVANVKGPPEHPRTRKGDVWELGVHRLICGDCRDHRTVKKLLAGASVNLAFTSPPYAEQRDYDETSGFKPIPPNEYVAWFAAVSENVRAHLTEDGSWFVNIKPPGHDLDTDLYVFDFVIAHVREWGWHFLTEFCWERNGVPKQVTHRFKNQFEPIYQFTRGAFKIRPDEVRTPSASAITPLGSGVDTNWKNRQGEVAPRGRKHTPPATGQGGARVGNSDAERNRAMQLSSLVRDDAGTMSKSQGVPGGPNVGNRDDAIGVGWAYPGNRLPTFSGSHTAVGHSAAFPVGLPGWFIRAYTDEGDTVFDPFMGSGSTLLAAHEEGRVGFGVEVSPGYCDMICARFQEATGIRPKKAGAARSVDFLKRPRT